MAQTLNKIKNRRIRIPEQYVFHRTETVGMGSSRLASRAGRGSLCAGEIWTCILVSRCLVSGKFIVVIQKGTGAKCVVVFVFRARAFGLIVYLKVYVLLFKKLMRTRKLIK